MMLFVDGMVCIIWNLIWSSSVSLPIISNHAIMQTVTHVMGTHRMSLT